jgi:hypothetical protein
MRILSVFIDGRGGPLGIVSRTASIVALSFALAASAAADVVHLKDGKKLEGKVTKQGSESITIETKFGPMDVKRSLIERIESTRLPEEEVTHRIQEAGDDAAKLWEVADYAKEKKLTKRVKEIAEKVVKLDPRHRGANEALGKVEYEGRWFTPEELEAHKAKFEADMKAQGKELIDGVWMDNSAAMQKKGFEEYEGEWLKPGEVYKRKAAKLMPELLGTTLGTVDSARFTMRSPLAQEECQELLDMLESGYAHFVERFQPNELERKLMDYYPYAVYVLPSADVVAKFVEPGGYMDQMYNPPKGINERYVDSTSFPIFFPRPLIVTALGRHLKGTKSASLAGFMSNLAGNVFVRRFKRNGALPGWVETGVAHYYEARLNGFQTLTIIDYVGFDHIVKWDNQLISFKDWYAAMAKPEFRAQLPPLSKLRDTKVEEIDAKGLVKSYFLVRWLMDSAPDKLSQYTRRAFEQNISTRTVTPEATAWDEVFAVSSDQMDAEFAAWLDTLPPNPVPFGQ